MYLKKIKKTKLKVYSQKKILFSSVITLGLLLPSNVVPQPLIINPKFSNTNTYSKKSFITAAVEKTGPSVVTIETQKIVKKRKVPQDSQIFSDPFFEKFFGLDLPKNTQQRIEQSQGSGFIFQDGLVMTNAHVVNGSDKVFVGLTNGKKIKGKVIGQDIFTDLAVLKIEGEGPWPKAKLGDSSKIKVGDWAIAVGNPFGLENTVTLGIISNLKRNVTQLGIYDKKFELIQTDAAINPGNSGGPLLNSKGEVIGINTLIRSGPGAGLSFAIPINKAKKIAFQLINNGKVIHPMIGISLIEDSNFERNNNSVKVGYVVPNSPAQKSGIMVNDIIIKVDNKYIENASDVINQINENGINKRINILLKRKNKFISLNVIPTDITNIRNK
ncbi:serine protease [Prochlorococcus marinus str. MU1404]|uniref:trypsin-like peptidase domain-containing protein n=1 Tax=Prochlorococcus marinus TaxID=1219 RepID=UPI001ADD3FC1|nr:trypsin-like peptidase domain-containing protein [Prochlorococcus marinus]MBO8229261.1 trypsin-like serine protease [Prochlorococcus marinus XMU1404]MBW3072343.1 serine protease [Prochlorococcus marinus str. MU1404]MCR8544556.1 trypsin-like peptidase domain-containing protein [Prochlorococcus marinus CUG1432]